MSSPSHAPAPRVAVVGSGISGLSSALRLEQAGFDVDLIERDPVLGGRFGVSKLGDKPVMLGGKNIGRKYTAFRSFLAALGDFEWEPFGINASTMKEGELLTIDTDRKGSRVQTFLRAAAGPDLLRIATLAARIQLDEKNKFLGSKLFTQLSEANDDRPLAAHFGPGVTNTILRPMTVRMNGAEPDEVYLGTFGTNLSLLLDQYDQLTDGIQPALQVLSRQVNVLLDSHVDSLVVEHGRVTGLVVRGRDGVPQRREYDGVVLATPAYATADILAAEQPTLSKRLSEVNYFPTSVVLVEYDRPVFTPRVRALAMNDGGPCSNAGAYGATQRHIVRYTFSGRPGRAPGLDANRLEDWVGEAEQRLLRNLGLRTPKRVNTLGRTWDAGYCGYLPYHAKFLSDTANAVKALPGLELSGDYLWGVSIEACTRAGNAAADRLTGQLSHLVPS